MAKKGKSGEGSLSAVSKENTRMIFKVISSRTKGGPGTKVFRTKQYKLCNQQKTPNLHKLGIWLKFHGQLVIKKRQGWMALESDSSVLA